MKRIQQKRRKEHKFLKFTYIKFTVITLFLCLLWVPGYVSFSSEGENVFHVMLNGVSVGTVADEERAEEILWQARYQVASERDGFSFLEAELETSGEEMLWGEIDAQEDVLRNMIEVLRDSIQTTLKKAYTVKVDDYMVNLSSQQEVEQLFQAAIDKYDKTGSFQVKLVHAPQREFSVYTAVVEDRQMEEVQEEQDAFLACGVQNVLSRMGDASQEQGEPDFDDYAYGVLEMDLVENVEVVEAFLPANQIASLEDAINHLISEQEVPVEYLVVSGDTLSEIALKVNIPMEQIVALNRDLLDNVNSPIYAGDKLIITVPEPELSIRRVETKYYEEVYEAEVEYVDNNDWYTDHTVILQQPSSGFRKIAVEECYVNDEVVERTILKQEIVKEAVALRVERGTRIPPTFIKPLYGGKLSSGYGYRKISLKGASTYHQAIDWATPTGTTVFASCSGTVTKAGWASGYGYVVYIKHEGGMETRYAHNSKVLVTVGQKVKQGEKIALSGNTGNSTGPHVHFEILVNGVNVNPLNYLDK